MKNTWIETIPKQTLQVAIQIPIAEMIKKDARKYGVSVSSIIRDCVLERYLKRYLEHREKQMRKEIEAIEQEENPRE